MDKGTRVRVLRGPALGQRGVVFWSGPSKYGGGLRLGVKTDGGETVWLGGGDVEAEAEGGGAEVKARFPYRFYGHGCGGDWIEGANDGHCFTLQFEREPDDDELTLLGELFTDSLRRGRARPGYQDWRWSGPWALFNVGERGRATGEQIVSAVEGFLDQAHALVPLVDVVYFNAREGVDGWDRWSIDQCPPDPGPFEMAQVGLFPRPYDPSLPKPSSRPAFEQGRTAKARAEQRAKLEAALAKQARKRIRVVPVAEEELPPRPDPHRWAEATLAGFEVPSPQVLHYTDPSGSTWNEWQAGDHPLADVPGRPLAWVVRKAGEAASNLAWLDDDGQRHAVERWKPAVAGHRFGRVVVHPSAAYAMVSVDRMKYLQCTGRALYRVNFETGRARAVYTLDADRDGGLGRFVFVLGGERLAVSTSKRLLLMDTATDRAAVVVAEAKQSGNGMAPAFDGRAILADTGRSWRLYGVARDTLKKLGTITNLVSPSYEHGGRMFARGGDEEFEIVGASAAVDRFHAKHG